LESLVEDCAAKPGDLVADLKRFPSVAYSIQSDQTSLDITTELMTIPDYWAVARAWLVSFTSNTGLQDSLAVDGYGFWWTLNAQKFVPALSELGNVFAWIDLLAAIHKYCAPGDVIVYGQHQAIVHLVDQVFEGVTIRVQFGAGADIPARGSRRQIGLIMVRLLMGVAYLVYMLFLHSDVIFLSTTNLVRRQGEGEDRELRDVYLDDLAHALQVRGWRTVFVEKYGPNASWQTLRARGFYFPNDLIFLLASPLWARFGFHRRITRRWLQKWDQSRPILLQHLNYQGYDIAPMVLPWIRGQFTRTAPTVEVMVSVWRRTLRHWRPKLVFVNNSYGLSALPAIIAAKLLGIPTMELQHGVIAKGHHPYLVPRDVPTESEFPLCDTLVVRGDRAKRLLVDSGVYEASSVAVSGFPRTDSLLGSLPPREMTLAKLAIEPRAKVILYTSNLVASGFYTEILDSIQLVREHQDIWWVIKLHPREKTRDLWEEACAERALATVRIVEAELDFYALLAASDVHVSFTSTTLIEAAILEKVNLGLAIPNVPDPIGYAEAKAFLPVAPDQLGPTVLDILRNPDKQRALLREQKRFAEDWCLHDGHAVDRIVALIEEELTPSG
jgi:hypothetical protein